MCLVDGWVWYSHGLAGGPPHVTGGPGHSHQAGGQWEPSTHIRQGNVFNSRVCDSGQVER